MTRNKAADADESYPIAHASFVLDRVYPVPPARVFSAFADAAKKRRWFVEGEGWEVFEYTLDFRIGGTEVSRFAFKGGPEIRNDTQFQDIIPNRRIVFSYRMTIGPRPLSVSLSTVDLTRTDGGTLMTYTEQGAYFDSADSVKGREEGSRQLLERLAEELQSEA
jgi:uncharacterized protein YndB with AHSA1/START domain